MGTPKSELKKWEQQILEEKDWRIVREGLEVKLCTGRDGSETSSCRPQSSHRASYASVASFARTRPRNNSLIASVSGCLSGCAHLTASAEM